MKKIFAILISIALISITILTFIENNKTSVEEPKQEDLREKGVNYETQELITSLDRPWDIDFLPSGEIIFTQRNNKFFIFENGELFELNSPENVYVNGEGGLMGIAVDPLFEDNNYIYACFNSKIEDTPAEIVVARFVYSKDEQKLTDRVDIITNIPANESGRHSGCQLEFGPDNYLWVGTGDAAKQEVPQDPKGLGGKILRVDRDGNAAQEQLEEGFDPRIYSYGHRNVQGISFFKNEEFSNFIGISIEHGPDRDDEINLLQKGNFGWDPLPFYGEAVPMTDLDKYPEAISAIWSSGFPTIATSGGTTINSSLWGEWQNSIAVAAQKGSHIRIIKINNNLEILDEIILFLNEYGRFRTLQEDSQGNLYLLTDNGYGNDKIIKLFIRE